MSFPLYPPRDWFSKPEGMSNTQKITVEDSGRVYGYVALFDTCLLNKKNLNSSTCWKVPREDDYSFAMQGDTKCDDGSVIHTANIGGDRGHAPDSYSAEDANKFYADTSTQLMRVVYGADEYGIWCAGALWPDVTETDIARIKASPLSGDWRRIDGEWSFVGSCLVNIPGLPISDRMVASATMVNDDVVFGDCVECTVKDHVRLASMGFSLDDSDDDNGLIPFSTIMFFENKATGDGRFIKGGATTWRELPLPLLSLWETTGGGHMGAVVVGSIREIKKLDALPDGSIPILGTGYIDSTLPAGEITVRMLETKSLKGISVDGGDYEIENLKEIDEAYYEGTEVPDMIFSMFEIAGATIVPIPAFADTTVSIDGIDDNNEDASEEDDRVVGLDYSSDNASELIDRISTLESRIEHFERIEALRLLQELSEEFDI